MRPDPSHPSEPIRQPSDPTSRDRGAVLPLVLVLMVIGALVVLPMMSYATTVLRANTVLSVRTQRFEAVKAGLRTALYDPLDLYRSCDQSQGAPVAYRTIDINGVEVNSTCQLVGFAKTAIDDHLRYALAATEVGQSVPVELKGTKFVPQAVPAECTSAPKVDGIECEWKSLAVSTLEDDPNESRPNTIWLPDLPAYPDIVRTRVQGYEMPQPRYPKCTVYFPGKYVDDIVLTGPTFFTSGIYYFEGEVRVEGGANVVVGDGRYPGCATSQQAVFDSEPTLPVTEPHSITGFGATWLFGSDGRLVVSNDNGKKLDLVFNRRYVDDRTSDPSLYVSIASVNGEVLLDDSYGDLSVPGVLNVPLSRVMTAKDTYRTAKANKLVPSSLTPAPRPPAAPTDVAAVGYRVSSSANQGGAYITWRAPDVTQWGGAKIDKYEIRRSDTGATTIIQATDAPSNRVFSTLITGLPGSNTSAGATTTFEVVAISEHGLRSEPATTSQKITNVSSTQAAPGTPLTPTVTSANRFKDGFKVTVTAPSAGAPAAIVRYTVTAHSATSPFAQITTPGSSCVIEMQVTPTPNPLNCTIRGLTANTNYKLKVQVTNPYGTSSSTVTSTTTNVTTLTTSGAAATGPDAVVGPPTVPPVVAEPIVDIDISHTTPNAAPASIRIPGYIAVPQGTVAIDNAPGHQMQIVGGMLAARYDVIDGRVGGPECTTPPTPPVPGWVAGQNCVDLGFESETVQMRLRVESTTPSGHEKSVAVVQVNENGAFSVNSWEVQ